MSYPNLHPALTPQRPLPGAFFQTPGPNNVANAPVFSPKPAPAPAEQPSPASLPKLPPAASKSKSQTLSTEERAARTVNDTLIQEARYPDLDSYLSRK
jgi:nuclear pore complex protein Nup155